MFNIVFLFDERMDSKQLYKWFLNNAKGAITKQSFRLLNQVELIIVSKQNQTSVFSQNISAQKSMDEIRIQFKIDFVRFFQFKSRPFPIRFSRKSINSGQIGNFADFILCEFGKLKNK